MNNAFRLTAALLPLVIAGCGAPPSDLDVQAAGEVRQAICGDAFCDVDEDEFSCPEDCGPTSFCGDGNCDVDEDEFTCPDDCGQPTFCGDAICDVDEDEFSCPEDCGPPYFCGDGNCDVDEDEFTCPDDCGPPTFCGDAICDVDEDEFSCPEDCGPPYFCGDGNCDVDEDEFTCPDDCGPPTFCGDAFCDVDEDEFSCPEDCGPPYFCGDGNCDVDEDEFTCPEDCGMPGYCGDGLCEGGEDCGLCPEDCCTDGGPYPDDGGPYPEPVDGGDGDGDGDGDPDGGDGDGDPDAGDGDGDGDPDAGDGDGDGDGDPDAGDGDGDGDPDAGDGDGDGDVDAGDPPECMSSDACDDGMFCNGMESCTDGACEAAGADAGPDCDDNKVCTVDYCSDEDEACINEFSDNLCTCNPPDTVDVSVNFEAELETPEVECVGIGGTVKEKMVFSASGAGHAADCENDCTEDLAIDGSIMINAEVCGKRGVSVNIGGMGNFTHEMKKCMECNEESCENECTDDACHTDELGGGLGFSVSKFYGYATEAGDDPVKAEIKCGATATGSFNVNGRIEETEALSDCIDCEQCLAGELGLGGGLNASADCYVGFEIYGYKKNIGCNGCASIGANPYAGVRGQTGECGGELCGFAGVDAHANVGLSTTIGIGWFSVTVGCSAGMTGCAEASDCGSCEHCDGCADINTSFSCRVR